MTSLLTFSVADFEQIKNIGWGGTLFERCFKLIAKTLE